MKQGVILFDFFLFGWFCFHFNLVVTVLFFFFFCAGEENFLQSTGKGESSFIWAPPEFFIHSLGCSMACHFV